MNRGVRVIEEKVDFVTQGPSMTLAPSTSTHGGRNRNDQRLIQRIIHEISAHNCSANDTTSVAALLPQLLPKIRPLLRRQMPVQNRIFQRLALALCFAAVRCFQS